MNKSEKIATLMFRYARRELTNREKKELTALRHARPDIDNLFKGRTDPEDIITNIGHFLSSKEKSLQKMKDRYPDIWKDPSASRHFRLIWIFGITALFIVLLSIGILMWMRS